MDEWGLLADAKQRVGKRVMLFPRDGSSPVIGTIVENENAEVAVNEQATGLVRRFAYADVRDIQPQ